jgi:hypothetical protein
VSFPGPRDLASVYRSAFSRRRTAPSGRAGRQNHLDYAADACARTISSDSDCRDHAQRDDARAIDSRRPAGARRTRGGRSSVRRTTVGNRPARPQSLDRPIEVSDGARHWRSTQRPTNRPPRSAFPVLQPTRTAPLRSRGSTADRPMVIGASRASTSQRRSTGDNRFRLRSACRAPRHVRSKHARRSRRPVATTSVLPPRPMARSTYFGLRCATG